MKKSKEKQKSARHSASQDNRQTPIKNTAHQHGIQIKKAFAFLKSKRLEIIARMRFAYPGLLAT